MNSNQFTGMRRRALRMRPAVAFASERQVRAVEGPGRGSANLRGCSIDTLRRAFFRHVGVTSFPKNPTSSGHTPRRSFCGGCHIAFGKFKSGIVGQVPMDNRGRIQGKEIFG